jgi:dihydrofolate reductase
MNISLIVAVAENGVIGKRGAQLPWHLSTDIKRFRSLTMGHTIVMGRSTHESIGHPLPGRRNIVVTHNQSYTADGCTVAHSLEEAFKSDSLDEEVFVSGGAQLLTQALPLADKLYLTVVHAKPVGDVFFKYDLSDWRQLSVENYHSDASNDYDFSFMTYSR